MRCEYLINPIGIDTPSPRFSWKLEPIEGVRSLTQTAWQIKLSDSEGTLLWDSGKVESSQSVNIAYEGESLSSNQDCNWQVRLWNGDNRIGPWSEPARFVMGLLDETEWTGPWIRLRLAQDVDHIWYRKAFSLEKIPERALLHLASIGYHELYINGHRVDDRVLAPSVSNLTKKVFYVSYDVESFLVPGKNVIGVWTGAAWAMADGSYGKGVWEQDSLIRCQFNTSDGLSLSSDESWKCKVSHVKHRGKWKGGGLGEYGGERIDARLKVEDWNLPGYDDSLWLHASAYTDEGLSEVRKQRRDSILNKLGRIRLKAQQHEPDRKVKQMNPVSMRYDPETDQARFDMIQRLRKIASTGRSLMLNVDRDEMDAKLLHSLR
ncbi:MAG: alpha-L-rhamnosidase N-terminal domain-containing protein, partial [Opitutales bacterium]